MKRAFLAIALVLVSAAAGAQDWAKQRLEVSPRHREWVKVPAGPRCCEDDQTSENAGSLTRTRIMHNAGSQTIGRPRNLVSTGRRTCADRRAVWERGSGPLASVED